MQHNIKTKLEKYFTPEILRLLVNAGTKAKARGQELFLVGGSVRDLLLNRVNFDIDLVVEGDAIELAQELAEEYRTKIITHHQFGTAKLNFNGFSLDIATARLESYSKPGALPTVQNGTIKEDLLRRDFSINAMAVYISAPNFGNIIDPHNGLSDLNHHYIRILHPQSFIDDATRILRAIRYEQRLLFTLEKDTIKLLQRDAPMLGTISGTRIKHEVDFIFKEQYPEQIIKRAEELRVLGILHPSLRGDGWLGDKFDQARQLYIKSSPLNLYYCLLIYNLPNEDNEQFISHLNLPKTLAQMMRQTLTLKSQIHRLERSKAKPSEIYKFLNGYSIPALQTNMIATESTIIRQYLQLFISKLRFIKPSLTGDDLVKMGVPTGPEIGKVLNELHKEKLDGKIITEKDEETLVRSWRSRLSKP